MSNLPTEHSIQIPVRDENNLKTDYSGDSIGMELARRKLYATNPGEDTKQDENIYIVRTDGSETVQGGTNVSGLALIDQYYNIALTPRENLIRWGNILKVPLWKSPDLVKFVKSQKNIDFTYTNQNGDTVTELSDITASELTENRLFNPEMHTFEGKLTTAQIDELNSDPHRYIRYESDFVTYEGFIDKVETGDYEGKARFTTIAKQVSGQGDTYQFLDGTNYEFINADDYEFIT